MDRQAIQSSLAKPLLLCRIHNREETPAMEMSERTTQMAMMVGYCDSSSTSGGALRTQPMADMEHCLPRRKEWKEEKKNGLREILHMEKNAMAKDSDGGCEAAGEGTRPSNIYMYGIRDDGSLRTRLSKTWTPD